MTATLDWAEAAARLFEPPAPPRWPTPGDLAAHLDPRTVQTPALRLLDQHLVDIGAGRCDRLVWTMPPQEGKALALDTPIATPGGWTMMGALKVGDQVFDRHGKPCNVTWVSPTWSDRPCYTVRTGDGEAIVADAAHEWVARLDRRSGERVCDTALLAKTRSKNAQIIGPAGLELPSADLPLDPYVLGVWLGDGHTRAAMITCADIEIVERIRAAGVPCRKAKEKYAWRLAPEGWKPDKTNPSPVRCVLTELGVWGNKHVPDAYMRGSTEQRTALLQGLIDTDGYVDPRGQVEFCSTSERLANDVRELVFTLGAKATIRIGRATLNGKDCGPKYRVRFFMRGAAHLSRKAVKCADSSVARVRYAWAEPAASVPTRCIEVDSPDHTYLAGRTLLPTHNSQRIARTFPLWLLLQNPNARIGIASYELGVARRWGRAIRNDIKAHPELGLRVRDDTSAAHEWQLDGHDGSVYCVGIGGALTGRPIDGVLVIDDPVKGRAEADSETYRQNAIDWWSETASTRLAPGTPVIIDMTRWHEADLAGHMLTTSRREWTYVNVPALADHDPAKGETDPLGREPGQWMISARGRTVANWEQRQRDAGSRGFAALYQGRPSPGDGSVFKRDWWQWYDTPRAVPQPNGTWRALGVTTVIASWDLSFKDTAGTDYVCGQVWGVHGADAFLLDQTWDRLDFPATCLAVEAQKAKWPQIGAILVEDKANGPAVLSQLRRKVPGLIPVSPVDSKLARAHAVSPFVQAGNIHVPSPALAPWIGDWLEEISAFPLAAHDDRVDAMTQALHRLYIEAVSDAGDFMRELVGTRG